MNNNNSHVSTRLNNHIIALSNQKGGVGKTTLTRELGIYLAESGITVLVIDADPQGNLTKSLIDEPDSTLYEALTGESYQVQEVMPNLYLLAGTIQLSTLEKTLIGELDAYTRLRELLRSSLYNEFEIILVDCPPSLGILTINALAAAQHIIIPMHPALYSMQGTNDLMDTIAKVKKNINPDIKLTGVIINAFDSIPVISRQIRREIEAAFGSLVFHTALSKSIKIEEAIAARHGLIVLKNAKVKTEIEAIGAELVQRLNKAHEGESNPWRQA